MKLSPVTCNRCGDEGYGAKPGQPCGRDLSEERGLPDGTIICRGWYGSLEDDLPEPCQDNDRCAFCYHCGGADLVMIEPCEEHREIRRFVDGALEVGDPERQDPDGSGAYVFCRNCGGVMSLPEWRPA